MLLDKEENKRGGNRGVQRQSRERGCIYKEGLGVYISNRIRNRGEVCVSHSESCEN